MQEHGTDLIAEVFRQVEQARASHRVSHATHARRQAKAAERQAATERAQG